MSLSVPRMPPPNQQNNQEEGMRRARLDTLARRVGNIIITHLEIVQALYSVDAKYIHQGAMLSNIHQLTDLRKDFRDNEISAVLITEFQTRVSRMAPKRLEFMDTEPAGYFEIRAADLLNNALNKIKELMGIRRMISGAIKMAPEDLIDRLGLRDPLPAPVLELPALESSSERQDIHAQLQSIHERTLALERLLKDCTITK